MSSLKYNKILSKAVQGLSMKYAPSSAGLYSSLASMLWGMADAQVDFTGLAIIRPHLSSLDKGYDSVPHRSAMY